MTYTAADADTVRSRWLPKMQVFMENEHGRDFVAGDLHGQYTLLMQVLDEIGFDSSVDRLFLLGDLIDRGPESMQCLTLPYQPWCFSVAGNHEQMMLDAISGDSGEALRHWVSNGGGWMLQEEPGELRMLAEDLVAQLPLAIELQSGDRRLGMIHAGVTSGVWGKFDRMRDMWTRDLMRPTEDRFVPDSPIVEGIDAVAVGHCIREGVTVRGNVIGMDVGAARGYAPAVWAVDELLEAVDAHLRTGKVTTEYKPVDSLLSTPSLSFG